MAATNVAEKIVNTFVSLAETRFKGSDAESIQELIHETVAIETDADSLGIEITHTIFARRNSMDPVCTIFCTNLFTGSMILQTMLKTRYSYPIVNCTLTITKLGIYDQ